MSVKRIKNGRWEVRCRYGKVNIRKRFKDKWQARDFEQFVVGDGVDPEKAELLARGISAEEVHKKERIANAVSFADFTETYLEDYASGVMVRRGDKPEPSSVGREGDYLKVLNIVFAGKTLLELTTADYEKLRTDLLAGRIVQKNRKPYAPTTVRALLSKAKKVMAHAHRTGVIEQDVWVNCTGHYVAQAKKPHWKLDDVSRFLDAVKAGGRADHYLLFLLALTTGMRRGEIFALRKKDIDFNEMTLTVGRKWNEYTYSRNVKFGPFHDLCFDDNLKQGKPEKVIPIHPDAVEPLRDYCTTLIRPEVHLFAGLTAGQMRQPTELIRKYAPSAGVAAHIMHRTRDSFIGNMKRAGVQDSVIAQVAGCRIENLMRYGHLDVNDARSAISVLGIKSEGRS